MRTGIGVVLVVGGIGLGLTGCGSSAPPPAATSIVEPYAAVTQTVPLKVAKGAVEGGAQRVPVGIGKVVSVVVSSDAAGEVHVHGYDVSVQVPAGGSATLQFSADVPGAFEVEMHGLDVPLARLEVR